MPPAVAVELISVQDEVYPRLSAYVERVRQIGEANPRFQSCTLWKDQDFPERYAVVTDIEAEEDRAAYSMQQLIDDADLNQLASDYAGPVDIHTALVSSRHAATTHRVSTGNVMSLSIRRAEPGYGYDLLQELFDIFESLKYIDGYLGSLIGPNRALEEEVVAMVFWTTRRAFEQSLPSSGSFYEIRLFDRVL